MRAEFSKAVRKAALLRSGESCEECGMPLTQTPEYHHDLEADLGGDNSLENCKVLCIPCHRYITRIRRPALDKARRIDERRKNLRPKYSRPMPGSRDSGWCKPFRGKPYRRSEGPR